MAARVPTAEPAQDLTARVQACEAELERSHADIAILRREIADLRAALGQVGARSAGATGRKQPPPLPPDSSSEVISVDVSEVTMESIRPRPPRIR
jgi:hypothetical protein